MKTKTLLVRTAALSALLAVQACNSVQPPQSAHDPWENYKLGSVYDCDRLAQPDLRVNPQNTPSPGFGCAHQSNITLMAADPADLQRPRASTPADPTARQRVLDDYREGRDTSKAKGAQGTQGLIE